MFYLLYIRVQVLLIAVNTSFLIVVETVLLAVVKTIIYIHQSPVGKRIYCHLTMDTWLFLFTYQ